MARKVVFVGTSNEEDFLRDATGNRRFCPIAAERVDLEFVREHRDAGPNPAVRVSDLR